MAIATRLTTARLVLRPLSADDLADVVRIAGDYEVSKWLVPVPHPYTLADAQAFLQMDRDGALGTLWMITAQDRLVGAISTGKELGYWLDPAMWGQGLMTEAARAVVAEWFTATQAADLRSSYFAGNVASAAVLAKLGFVDDGGAVLFSRSRDAEVVARKMVLTREMWQAGRDAR